MIVRYLEQNIREQGNIKAEKLKREASSPIAFVKISYSKKKKYIEQLYLLPCFHSYSAYLNTAYDSLWFS